MFWTRSAKRARRPARRPQVETLEGRQLLSSSPPSSFVSKPAVVGPADRLLGASLTRNRYQVDGSGMTAAVIDTGVNYKHPALGGGFGPGAKVKAGYDFADRDPDPMPSTQHGTSVAGLIASEDPSHPGIAPEADIVALKVFGAGGRSDFADITKALKWVADNGQELGVSVVNISISDGGNYFRNFFPLNGGAGAEITGLIQKLAGLRIPVVVASGNSFEGAQGMGFPAIISESLSVTGTDLDDRFLKDAQRLGEDKGGANATDFAAPGAGLIAPTVGRDFSPAEGTSFATAEVTGSVLLLQQIYKNRFGSLPTVGDLSGWLKRGAVKITDPATGVTLNRVDLASAATFVPTPEPQSSRVVDPPAPPSAPPPPVVAPPPPVADPAINGLVLNGQALNPLPKDKVASLFGSLIAQLGTSSKVQVQVFGPPTASSRPPATNTARPAPTNWGFLKVWNARTSPSQNATSQGKPVVAASKLGPPRPASSLWTFWKRRGASATA